MSITHRWSGPPKRIPIERIARAFAALAPGAILEQVHAGTDIDGRPFAPYSAKYARRLAAAGEMQRVDLRLTGGLINSVKARRLAEIRPMVWEVVIAPDTGTSPRVSLRRGRASRTGRRGPPHMMVGHWLHYGTPRMRPRRWLGLSPQVRARLMAQIMRSAKIR